MLWFQKPKNNKSKKQAAQASNRARQIQPPAGLRLPPAFTGSITANFAEYPDLAAHSDKVYTTVAAVINRMLPLEPEIDQIPSVMRTLNLALSESAENLEKTCQAIEICVRASAAARKPDLWRLWNKQIEIGWDDEDNKQDIFDRTRTLVQIYNTFNNIWPEGRLSLASLKAVEVVLKERRAVEKRNDLERVVTDADELFSPLRRPSELPALSGQFAMLVSRTYGRGSVFLPYDLKRVEYFFQIDQHTDTDFIKSLSLTDRKDYIKYLFSRQRQHPDLSELDSFSARIAELDAEYYKPFVTFRGQMRGALADQEFGKFLDLMTSKKIPEDRRLPLILLLSHAAPDRVPSLIGLITEISRLEDEHFAEECYGVLADPETDVEAVLSDLIQKVYAQSSKEFAIRFPEKPLEEVLQEFLDESVLTEPVSREELDRAGGQYEEIVRVSVVLQKLSTEELGVRIDALRGQVEVQGEPSLIEYLALARETFRRLYGVYPYNTQILAVLLMLNRGQAEESRGVYAQIKTGEGKSLVIPLLSGYYALRGETVDVVTSNDYLAERDARRFEPLFSTFGISSDYFTLDAHEEVRPETGVLYSTNTSFILHYLLEGRYGRLFFDDKRKRICIADEADNLLLDSFAHSVRIADIRQSEKMTDECYQFLMQYVDNYGYTGTPEQLEEVREEVSAIIHEEGPSTLWKINQLSVQELKVFLHSAYESQTRKKDVHYVVEAVDPDGKDRRVVILDDQNTGRKLGGTQWSYGLHKFVSFREDLSPPPDWMTSLEHSHHAFFRQYNKLYCLSGTIGDNVDRGELRGVYDLNGFDVPPHRKSIREDTGITLLETKEEQVAAITDRIQNGNGRPVLVICENVRESEALRRELERKGISAQLLNDVNNLDINGRPASEAEIVEAAGKAGMVTIATNVAGRGTDIIIDAEAAELGGLHEITTFIPINVRVEFQARGRAGRQGNPGSSEIITYQKDNPFFERLLPSEAELIKQLRLEYGAESPQISALIEWIRESRNIISSRQQIRRCALDEEHDRIIAGLFTDIRDSALRIVKSRRDRNLSSPPDAVKNFANNVFDKWTPEYSGYDISKAYSSLLCDEAVDAAVARVQEGRNPAFDEAGRTRYEEARERMQQVFQSYESALSGLKPELEDLLRKTLLSRAAALAVVQDDVHYEYWREWLDQIRKNAEAICEELRKKPFAAITYKERGY